MMADRLPKVFNGPKNHFLGEGAPTRLESSSPIMITMRKLHPALRSRPDL